MFEHDCDTDEDCEVYFLKPVNEYNIVDKIKEANKELFDDGEDSIESSDEQRKKVKFHPNLEQYEPNPGEEEAAGEENEVKCLEMTTLNEDDDDDVERASNNEDGDTTPRTTATIEECAEMLALEVQKKIEAIEIKMAEESDEEVDEISEEIVVMDMETGRKLEEDTREINAIKEDIGSELIKQDTISTKDDADSDAEVPDDDDDDGEQEGDDNLSIIVASYLPPDVQTALDESDSQSVVKTQSFKRNFSFRRKNSARRNKCRSPDITSLKLNYKTCCEYRNSDCAKLPKYTGYMSEYGLSRDQLEKREQTLQSKHKVIVEKNLKATEADVQKMQDNERAFTTWLKNKMRFPINRTKNMFDVKKTNNMNGGNSRGGVFRPKLCGSNKNGGVL